MKWVFVTKGGVTKEISWWLVGVQKQTNSKKNKKKQFRSGRGEFEGRVCRIEAEEQSANHFIIIVIFTFTWSPSACDKCTNAAHTA